ncbi:pseudouridine synthase [Peptostreptococcus sp. D1]|uniref:pseudouridine synthase n=1 Tax=Peptostreptococcus sp. D1 TaxID=72304 RepID=UPI0008F34EC4|nr:pseudouridine synthase [Peptostreptococcus sp. D1]SFE75410.1 16S rRNA pseudouridine516 synthase [Peptostreptococcus sp. D1]
MRLDKLLGNMGYGTRSEIKKYCKRGLVFVNDKEVKKSDVHVNPEQDRIVFNDIEVIYKKYIYLMMNKPSGVVSATFDKYDDTVIDLIDFKYQTFELFPVGRLDKDTEGLLVLTNDGQLAHRILSPKKHVPKKYYVEVDGKITEYDVKKFKEGLDIGEEKLTKPAILESNGDTVFVTITEGKFHQIKRMFEQVGKKVTYLKRVKMGSLELDEGLKLGEYRELTKEEIERLEGRD